MKRPRNRTNIDLTEYDIHDLAQKVGGSQLLPENADHYVELTRAAAVICSHAYVPALFKMNGSVWGQWINSGDAMQNGPEMGGDPHEGLFIAEVPFFGGGYYCIPSASPEDPFTVELLLEAALHSVDAPEFQRDVAAVAQLGLYLSDECLRKAGLSRTTHSDCTTNVEIRWPGEGKLSRRLQEAVTFDTSGVLEEMARRNVSPEGLRHLVFDVGKISADYDCPLGNPVITRPIGRTNDELIVVAPTNLLPAIREAVLSLAEVHRVLNPLIEGVEESAVRCVGSYLDGHRWQKVGFRPAKSDRESDARVYQFDADKLAFVHLVTDCFTTGSREVERRHWDVSPQLELVAETASAVQVELSSSIGEVLHLVLLQGLGRPYVSRLPDLSSGNISSVYMTVDELRVASQLNGDSLALWQFAKSKQSKHGIVPILGGGFLDDYARYRERDSFYTSDDGIPDMILATGLGRNVRLEAQEKRDPHIVRMPNDTKYGRVFRLQNIAGFPIYTIDPSSEGPIKLLVEELPFPLWVVSPVDEEDESDDPTMFYHLADVIAFWIWQLTPTLHDWSAKALELPEEVVVGVSFAKTEASANIDAGGLGLEAEVVGNQLRLRFDSVFIEQSSGKDNSAERQLARQLLVALAACLEIDASAVELENAIETHAPLGLKRRMKSFDQSTAVMIDNSGLPRMRRIQAFEMERIRDDVGRIAEKHVTKRKVLTRKQSHKIHQKIVETMFVRLEGEIKHFNDDELLPLLIARHEALIAERRRTESIVGTHLSAMGDSEIERRKLQEDLIEIDRASTASRFLIEYVSACPPSGSKQVSTSGYDRVLALASEIVGSGYLSDAFHLEVAEMALELVPSARLKFGTSAYATAVQQFCDDMYNAQADAQLALSDDESGHAQPRGSEIEKLIEAATTAEFGLSLEDIVFACGGIAMGEFTEAEGVGSAEVNDLVSSIETNCTLPRDSILRLVDQLSATARKKFLEPPKPYRTEEVYPWRFNRRLTYLRKPLVRRGNRLFWGRRAVIQAATYLGDLVDTGRIKFAESPEMKQLIGKIADHRGKVYNRRLAQKINGLPRYQVIESATQFSGRRMARSNSEDIGDVDVAVLDVASKIFYPVEAKSFTLAKTPGEVKNELDDLFNTDNKQSAVNRHLERVQWLTRHLSDVVQEFGVRDVDASEWTIEPILVLHGNLLSRYLADSPFPVMTETEFLKFLAERC